MIRLRVGLVLATALGGLPAVVHAQVDTLRYVFHYSRAPGQAARLGVDVDFRGDRSGRTLLVLPTTWAGEDSLFKEIVSIQGGPGVTVGPQVDGARVLTHAPGAPVHVHYELRQDWSGPLRYATFHRLVLDSTRVLFNETNALVFPQRAATATPVLQYQWTGLPPDWRILTSFGSKASFSGPVGLREFSAAAFAAGDFRLVGAASGDGGMTIAAQGHWPFTDDTLAGMVRSLWGAETHFWGAPAFAHPFVLLLPIADPDAFAGTAFTAGFVAVADSVVTIHALGRLLAHELFHLWNGQRLAATSTEARYKWITEGFTDYYADRIFHELGYYSDSVYMMRVNTTLRDYYTSAVARSTRRDVADRFWTDPAMKAYPYAQGYAFALYLQPNLRRWSGTRFDLDSLMVAAYRGSGGQNEEMTDSLLVDAAPAGVRAPLVGAIARYIDDGAMIPGDSAALGRCVAMRMEPVYTFDLGFDAPASMRDHVVQGVRPDGPAARAGIVNGMKLLGWRWDGDYPTLPVLLQVDDGHGPREVRYPGHGDRFVLAPQYAPTPGAPGCLTLQR